MKFLCIRKPPLTKNPSIGFYINAVLMLHPMITLIAYLMYEFKIQILSVSQSAAQTLDKENLMNETYIKVWQID